MTLVKIIADRAHVSDFRTMVGDDHFERSLLDAAINHIDAALEAAFGKSLLKIQFTSRGHIVWSPPWLEAPDRNLTTLKKQEVFRVSGVRPILDVPLDFDETVDIEQDPSVQYLNGFNSLYAIAGSSEPIVKVKKMKKWKRLTISYVDVCLPTDIFPWQDVDLKKCDCPACALIPKNDIIPAFYCGVCGNTYWCSCMSSAVQKLLSREDYDRGSIQRLTEQASQRDEVCHLCRGVPVTSIGKNLKDGVSGLMSRYFAYRTVAAIEHGGDWRAGENSLRTRLGIPKIGEGWIGEAVLLNRVIGLLPNEEIIHQGSPDWLGRQRFDIWIPQLKVAVEYNGQQHYAPVEVFGGEAGFAATRIRDAQKRQLCFENKVRLVEVSFDETITDVQLIDRIYGRD